MPVLFFPPDISNLKTEKGLGKKHCQDMEIKIFILHCETAKY